MKAIYRDDLFMYFPDLLVLEKNLFTNTEAAFPLFNARSRHTHRFRSLALLFWNVLIYWSRVAWWTLSWMSTPTNNVIFGKQMHSSMLFTHMWVSDPAHQKKRLKIKYTTWSSKSHIKYNRAAFSPGDTLESHRLQWLRFSSVIRCHDESAACAGGWLAARSLAQWVGRWVEVRANRRCVLEALSGAHSGTALIAEDEPRLKHAPHRNNRLAQGGHRIQTQNPQIGRCRVWAGR